MRRIRRALAGVGGGSIQISHTCLSEPSPVSSTETEAYRLIREALRETHPGAIAVPSLALAGTDSRYYAGMAENIYRFAPFTVTNETRSTIHGVNERIDCGEYKGMIEFYARLLRSL
ncbi:MAG: M20/M25/M40 family metallo-hydrolase [Patescibacteria group bacterium]